MKKTLALCLALVLAATCAAYAAPRGEEMRVGVSIDAKNFDPQNSVDTYSFTMEKQIYEPLFTVDGKTKELTPVLAEKYEQLDDHTYKIYLRKGVKFHNGEPFTADDVIFSLTRVTDPKQSVFAKSKGMWIDPNGFEKIDDHTLILRTRGPVGGFLGSMKHPYASILNRKAVETAGKDYFRMPVGTGPYKFVKWDKGVRVEMEAFDEYWGTKPYAKKLTFVVLPDNSSRVIALETGEVDMIYAVPASDFARLQDSKKVKAVEAPGLVLLHLAMNMDSPKLKDVRVRKAIDAAINKEAYIQVAYEGYGIPGQGPLPTACQWFPKDPVKWDYNPELAKKLLAEAAKDDPSVKDMTLELWVMNAKDRIDGATILQAMLGQVGIKVNVSVFENAVINDKIRKEHGHDLYASTWGMQTNRDAGVYWQSVITTTSIAATNSARISDPEIDKLMDEQNKCTNDADREALFQKIWDRMNDLHPWVYLCQAAELNGAQKDLIGLEDLYDGKINLLTNLHYPEQERLK